MLLRQKEAVIKYKVHFNSLRRWVKEGKLTEYRTPGGHRRYDSDELDQLFRRKKDDIDNVQTHKSH